MKEGRLYTSLVALIVAVGGFLLGFDATVISGAVPFIKNYFALTGTAGDWKLGLAVSCLGWGALGGNAVAGFLSDAYGRKKILMATALLFVGSAVLSAFATNFPIFVISRVLGGIAVGGAILIAPVYIAEISPSRLRGGLVSFNQLMIVLGISASFFSNYWLLGRGDNCWRWMLGVEAIPAALYFVLLFVVPESPRWLLLKGREQQALYIFERVAGLEHADAELRSVKQSAHEQTSGYGAVALLSSKMRFIMFIALTIAFFQQITGINAIFYYLPTIFEQAGGGTNAAFKQAVLVGLVNLVMTVVAIKWIDRWGRKPLLIVGTTGMAISLLVCGWAFKSSNEHALVILCAIVGFVASFAISLGPVMWVLLSEIFPNAYRGAAMSVVGFWNSVVSATVTMIFPWELSHFGAAGTFFGYGFMAAAALVFVILWVPETKCKSLEELEHLLVRQGDLPKEPALCFPK